MNILALETSTEACSVALMNEQGEIYTEFDLTPRQHTQFLPKMMNSVLQQSAISRSDISHIAYTNGPGAFTGIRIATATAQGLGIGLNVPLVPVSTLAVLAQQALDEEGGEHVLVALDARMGESYTAEYFLNEDNRLVEIKSAETIIKLEDLKALNPGLSVGTGFRARRVERGIVEEGCHIVEEVYPSAQALVKLAKLSILNNHSLPADQASINYIRNNVAKKKKKSNV